MGGVDILQFHGNLRQITIMLFFQLKFPTFQSCSYGQVFQYQEMNNQFDL